MYADDAAVFINPVKEEVEVVAKILEIFVHALGLVTNRDNCVVYPIQCQHVDLQEVMVPFQCAILNPSPAAIWGCRCISDS
jgi:hypothetical protein